MITSNDYRSEIEISKDRLFLAIEATLTPTDEATLIKEGFVFLNNGITLADGTPAFYFSKIVK